MQKITPPSIVISLAQACQKDGARLFLVGGSVRDALLGVKPKDWDLEVHGFTPQKLEPVLRKFAHIKKVGKSFGVWKLNSKSVEFDISVPVIQNQPAPFIGITEALRRRDLRINAIAYDPLLQQYIDPFNGQQDIEAKRLHYTDAKAFAEDPLRAFRVAQFAARLQFSPSQELISLCKNTSMNGIAVERISIELEKLFLRSKKPSIGLRLLDKLDLYSRSIPMWTYNEKLLHCIDRAVAFRTRSAGWNLALMWSVATHHLSHDKLLSLLDYLQIYTILGYKLRKSIVDGHQFWAQLQSRCSDTQLRTLAESTAIDQIAMISQSISPSDALQNLSRAAELGIENKSLPILIQGRDLVAYGYKGLAIGKKLKEIRTAQLEGTLQTREQVLKLLSNEQQK